MSYGACMQKNKLLVMLVAVLALLAGCRTRGAGIRANGGFTVSGTVSGVNGPGLLLQNNGTDDLAISADGIFTFPTALADGDGYAVTVETPPSGLICTVNNGSGVVAGANVTSVSVVCSASAYAIGGTVNGLTGAELVLQNNGGDDLTVNEDGPFTFPTLIADGAGYDVTVKVQPMDQTCTASANGGVVAGIDVTDISVTCSANAYAVGGTVYGLSGTGLALQVNGSDDLEISADGAFQFGAAVANGADYDVTVRTQPSGQTCSVYNGNGTVLSAEVGDIWVFCTDNPKHTIGGTVTGLSEAGLVLQNNGGDDLALSMNGQFAFATPISEGASYAVSVKTQPPGKTCSVLNGTGIVPAGDVTDVTVTCNAMVYLVGGTASGLAGGTVVLQNNGSDDLSLSANGSFTFVTPLASGATYLVTVKTQPAGQICSVTNGNGTSSGWNIIDVGVVCAADAFTISGTVSGLTGTGLVIQNNGGDDKTVTGNGAFTFASTVADGTPYSVTVKTQPAGQTCSVTNGTGTVAGANVGNVSISCAASYTIGGTITGLNGTVLIQAPGTNGLSTYLNGPFTLLPAVLDGTAYSVTIGSQPANQTCIIANGTGTVSGANVTNVSITCSTNTYFLGGTVSGLAGGTLVLQNNGGDDRSLTTNDPFSFVTKMAVSAAYDVTVKTQPSGQFCSVFNGAGIMPAADVTNISVTCSTASYGIGGVLSGATGTVVLRNNNGDDLSISGDGVFSFATHVADGGSYDVTVKSTGPAQLCSVTNGSGTVAGAAVTSVSVACVATKQRFLYATRYGGTWPSDCAAPNYCEIAVYRIDATEGTLTGAGTYDGGMHPNGIAIDPANKFAFVTNDIVNTVSAFAVNSGSGALSFVASSATGTNPGFLKVDPSGKFLYVVNRNGNSISGYGINGTSGALTELAGSPYPTGTSPFSVAIDPAGKHVYVSNAGSNDISAFAIDAATGVLSSVAGSPFFVSAVSYPREIAVNPSGTILYVTSPYGTVYVFAVNGAGDLTKLNGLSFNGAGSMGYGMTMNSAGSLLYVANYSNPGTLTGCSIGSGGALSATVGSPYTAAAAPWKAVIDPLGRFLFTAGGAYPNVAAYRIDAGSGVLTSVSGSPYASTSADDLAVTP